MKTETDRNDNLPESAQRNRRAAGRSSCAKVREGLRQAGDSPEAMGKYRLPVLGEGDPDGVNPLEQYSWQELRGIVYGEE